MDHPGIARARESVADLKKAIREEKARIEDYRDRLDTGRGGFPPEGLAHGIERSRHNVRVLKAAVVRQNEAIREMRAQARINDEMAQLRAGIEIPVEHEFIADAEGEADGGTD